MPFFYGSYNCQQTWITPAHALPFTKAWTVSELKEFLDGNMRFSKDITNYLSFKNFLYTEVFLFFFIQRFLYTEVISTQRLKILKRKARILKGFFSSFFFSSFLFLFLHHWSTCMKNLLKTRNPTGVWKNADWTLKMTHKIPLFEMEKKWRGSPLRYWQ